MHTTVSAQTQRSDLVIGTYADASTRHKSIMTPRVAWSGRLGVFFFLCIALPLAVPQPTPAPTLSGCQVCATTGDCSLAYLSNPGQYCGPWFDQQNNKQSCCCPIGAQCKLSNYVCKCSWATAAPAPSPMSNDSPPMPMGVWIAVAVGVAVFLSCCVGIFWCFVRTTIRDRRLQNTRPPTQAPPVVGAAIPMAVPACNVVPAPHAVYASTAIQYPYATAPTAPVYDYGNDGYGYHHHHHNTALAAVAGLATGMVIADIATDGFGGYDGGGSAAYDAGADTGGFSGGFDGGDTGGDFGGDF